MNQKKRIDILLVEKGLVESRQKAQGIIMSGKVYVENNKLDKCGTKIDVNLPIEVRGDVLPYVSRGGLKLKKAIKEFDISLTNKICIDIGASTGGFTDCMLQNGANKVFAIDVGYGQFAWKLRQHPKVVCMERTNIRYVTPEQIGQKVDFISTDVSFISLKLVLPVAKTFLKNGGELVCLIKPQFEAGREQVGKKGVVRDKNVHIQVIQTIVEFVQNINFTPIALTYSPITGQQGNIEYLLYLKKFDNVRQNNISKEFIDNLVRESHKNLKKDF